MPPAGPSPTPEDSGSATPGPEVVAASGSRPDPRTDATCADLTNPAALAPLFSFPVEVAPPTRTDEYIGAWISDAWFIRQLGGLACEWSTPDSITSSEGLFDYRGLRIQLLPASDADWAPFSAAEAGGGSRLFDCPEFRQGCQLDQLFANGWWLQIWNQGMPHLDTTARAAAAEAVFSTIADAVQALPAPTTPWAAPGSAVALPSVTGADDCEALVTSAQVQAATAEAGTITSEWNSYPGQVEAARSNLGVHDCRWLRDGFWDVVQLIWLPGGAWAQAEFRAATEALMGSPVDTPAVAGVPAGSTAFYLHVDSASLDLVIGGNWIKLQNAAGADSGTLEVRAELLAVGAALAANFPS